MSNLMSIAAAGLQADQARLEQLSLNAANASTPGYRRGVAVAVPFDQVLDSQGLDDASRAQSSLSAPALSFAPDMTPGALTRTGRSLDVALEGKGFMMVTDGEQTWLTRSGALQVNQDGVLTNAQGYRVVGIGGDIHVDASDITIDAAGHVLSGTRSLGQLRVVEPEVAAQMASFNGVLWAAPDGNYVDVAAGKTAIRSGFLEASNTNPLTEMTTLLENTRHFESLVHLVQGYDDVLGKTIQKLGEV